MLKNVKNKNDFSRPCDDIDLTEDVPKLPSSWASRGVQSWS